MLGVAARHAYPEIPASSFFSTGALIMLYFSLGAWAPSPHGTRIPCGTRPWTVLSTRFSRCISWKVKGAYLPPRSWRGIFSARLPPTPPWQYRKYSAGTPPPCSTRPRPRGYHTQPLYEVGGSPFQRVGGQFPLGVSFADCCRACRPGSSVGRNPWAWTLCSGPRAHPPHFSIIALEVVFLLMLMSVRSLWATS